MINNIFRQAIYFIACVLLQVLIFNNIHFLRIATPFVYLYFIIKMPVATSKSQIVCLSFLIGLVIDIFSNTPGMHASACTLAGFSRDALITFFAGKDLSEGIIPSLRTFTFGVYLRYVFAFVLIQNMVLFLIESLTLFDPLFLFLRLGASAVLTTLLLLAIDAFNLDFRVNGEKQ